MSFVNGDKTVLFCPVSLFVLTFPFSHLSALAEALGITLSRHSKDRQPCLIPRLGGKCGLSPRRTTVPRFYLCVCFSHNRIPFCSKFSRSCVFSYEWVLSCITCFFCILWVDCMFFSYSLCQSNNADWISDAELNLHNWIKLGLSVFTYSVGFNLLVLHVEYLRPMLTRDDGLWLFFPETSL